MRKLYLITGLCVCMLFGCAKMKADPFDKAELYQTYYSEIRTTKTFIQNSEYYSMSTQMTKLGDNNYRYYVIIDEPKIAMYHCRIFALENDIPYEENDKMMPTLGIFDTDVSLVPNQINKSEGFMKGLVIGGESREDHIDLKILVEWQDESGTQKTKQYVQTMIQYPREE